jgi:SRSO17 transposase
MKQSQHTTPQAPKTTLREIGGWVQELIDLHSRIAPRFARPEPRRRALAYLKGLMSSIERKNSWQIAEHARETTPYGMQRLLSRAVWDADVVRDDVREHVLSELGHQEGIGVIDETSFLKAGNKSAGVAVQYCGSTGEIENCQVAVFLAYVTTLGHTLIDRELYLPAKWIEDPERCQQAGIPPRTQFQTKPELALMMLERVSQASIAFKWVVADSVYGSHLDLRLWLEAHGYAYVMAVHCNEPVGVQTQQGRQWVEVREVEALLLTEQHWQRLSMSHGTKGPRTFDWACVPILYQWQDDGHHWVLIRRCLDDPKQKTYYFVFGPPGTTLQEMVKAIGARWHVEEVFETAKDMGLDHYEVRTWTAWYRHITLVMLAHAFLTGICAKARAQAVLPPVETQAQAPGSSPPAPSLIEPSALCAISSSPHRLGMPTCQREEAHVGFIPLIPLTVPEVRHLLGSLIWPSPRHATFVLDWSDWRRHHQWLASFYHTKRRLEAG